MNGRDDPFDTAADGYDASFSELPEVKALRARIYRLIRDHFGDSGTILDLGCGTGEDALHLARMGFAVTAVDPSAAMLEQARRKVKRFREPGPEGGIQLLQMAVQEIRLLPAGSFDCILSNFGALNCEGDLSRVLADCGDLLKDGGVMVLCLLNRFSVWESAAFLTRGRYRQAVRRWGAGPVAVPVGSRTVRTWYYSAGDVKRAARPGFRVRRVAGLNFIAPPPASRRFVERHPRTARFLAAAEEMLQSSPLLSRLGDHVVVVLERRVRSIRQ